MSVHPPIIFIPVEEIVIAWLTPLLALSVSGDVPNPAPLTFVRAERTGGVRRGPIHREDQVAIESWARRKSEAAALGELVQAHMYAMPGHTVAGAYVSKVGEMGGLAVKPDPVTESPRYSQTFTVFRRGAYL